MFKKATTDLPNGGPSAKASASASQSQANGPVPAGLEHISKSQMKNLLKSDYAPEKLEKEFINCCKEHPACSGELEKIAQGIESLASLRPTQYVSKVAGMEESLQTKCAELKKQRTMITQLLSQSAIETTSSSTHMDFSVKNAETQVVST